MEEAAEQEAAKAAEEDAGYRSRSAQGGLQNWLSWAIFVVAVAIVLLSMWNVWFPINLSTGPIVHLALTTFIITMAFIRRRPTRLRIGWIVLVQVVAWIALFFIYQDQLELLQRLGFATPIQLFFMGTVMAVLFYYSWIMFGPVFAVTAGLFGFYAMFGDFQWLPFGIELPRWLDLLRTAETTWNRALSIMTLRAVQGTIVVFSFSFLFMLLIMGALLQSSGGIGFVWSISRGITRRVSGGPGLIAVLSSSSVATFTGGGAANAGITGVVTIPMMKNAGYSPEKAAAIEAVASVAGGITPPILGAVAFIMADFVGKTYFDIVVITAIPAVLFYLGLATYIIFSAQRDRINMTVDDIPEVPRQTMAVQMTTLLLPMLVLVLLLVQRLSIQLAVFWTVITILIVWGTFYILSRFGMVHAQPEWRNARRNIVQAAVLAAGIAMAAATLDVLLSTIQQTGLGLRVASQVADWGGALAGVLPWGGDEGSLALVLTLVIAIVASYFLGLGLPALPVYVISAVLLAPALVSLLREGDQLGLANLGLDDTEQEDAFLIVAHYIMYYTALVFPNINPPVASTVLVTGQMAGANYLRASIEATKYAGGAMYLPFLLFFGPELLLVAGFSAQFWHHFALVAATIVVGQAGLAGFLGVRHNIVIRIIGIVTPALTFIYLWQDNPVWEIAAVAAIAVVFGNGIIMRLLGGGKQEEEAPAPAALQTEEAQ